MFDARTHLPLQQCDEIISLDLAVTEEAWTYGLTCSNAKFDAPLIFALISSSPTV